MTCHISSEKGLIAEIELGSCTRTLIIIMSFHTELMASCHSHLGTQVMFIEVGELNYARNDAYALATAKEPSYRFDPGFHFHKVGQHIHKCPVIIDQTSTKLSQ